MDINSAVSKNIKNIREKKKLTLDSASSVTGVSRSMLAQIEKGDVNPTISVLWKIANGYKVSFTELIENKDENADFISLSSVTPFIEDEGRYINYPAFMFDESRLFETYRIVISPNGFLQAQPHISGSEEYITVVEGSVEITVGENLYCLNKGDSISFKADTVHSYKNTGMNEAALSMIIYYRSR